MIMLRVVCRAPLARKFKMEVLIHSWTIRTARLTEKLEHFSGSKLTLLLTGRFYTKDALFVWTNLDKHLYFVWLCVSSIKTPHYSSGSGEPSFEICLERRTIERNFVWMHDASCARLYTGDT